MFFGKKKETPEEKEARLNRIHAEMQQICDQGKDKYDKLCAQVQAVLETANKPSECNLIRFAEAPYLFPQLKSYQYFTDWEVWRSGISSIFTVQRLRIIQSSTMVAMRLPLRKFLFLRSNTSELKVLLMRNPKYPEERSPRIDTPGASNRLH